MAASDKNIVISPQRGSTTLSPTIAFTGDGNDPVTLYVPDGTVGSLSFEGSAGQLFSITNNLTSGSIFSVNDVSGIPSLDIDASGLVQIAPLGGEVALGQTTVTAGNVLDVKGNVRIDGDLSVTGTNLITNLNADLLDGQDGSYYRNASNINAGTLNDSRLSYTELGRSPVGNFGQWASHSAYADFNTPPAYWGWTYLNGTTNAPNGSSAQWYRGRFSLGDAYGLGSDTGDYWMEMAIPRYSQGGAPGNLWIRTCESGTEQSWHQVAATISGNTSWHAGNDGSGSGLDADLLDGQQSTYYLNTSATTQTKSGGLNVSGNVGIGTTNPTARLHIATSSGVGILVEDTLGDTVFEADDGNGHVTVGNRLYIGGTTNYLSSLPTGNYGSVQVNGNGGGGWEGYSIDGRAVFMHDGSTTMGLYDDVNNHWVLAHSMQAIDSHTGIYGANGQEGIRIHGNGNVGIGTTNPTDKLYVSGGATIVGNLGVSGDINSSSDIKLKTNIKTLTNSLEKVLSLRGVEYDRIDMDNKHQIGVIAQEVEEIVPELVSENNGIKSVSYGNITALLIEAIKEQQKQIEALCQEISDLRSGLK